MIKDQEVEDIRNREKQRAAQRRYQEELDRQVNELRQRSIDSLTSKFITLPIFSLDLTVFSKETMNEEEMKYNTALIQKSSMYLK